MSPENLAPRRRYPISKEYPGMDECMYYQALNERVEVSVRPEHTTRRAPESGLAGRDDPRRDGLYADLYRRQFREPVPS